MKDVLAVKADQVPEFRQALLQSRGKKLVEAVKNETYWASGLDTQDTLHTKPEYWFGKNRMGELLMELRAKLQNDEVQVGKKGSRVQVPPDNRKSARIEAKQTRRHDAATFMDDDRCSSDGEASHSTG